MHSTLDSVKCTTCHHTSMEKGEPEDCHNCHHAKQEKGEEASKSMDAFHTRCQGCHEYTVKSGKTAGPVKKCFLCHEKKKKKK